MYQRARIPEIRLDSKLINENLSFNSTNQQLIIPYRRGASSEGNRNKEEELMITISNIPDGYTIAKEINGVYESVGATDAFGTTTLFSVPKSNKTSEQLAKFELLNEGNLYLVASHKHAINLKNNSEMRIGITSSIQGEKGVNTRSETITANIKLTEIETESIKHLNISSVFIDPIVVDLSGREKLPLSKIDVGGEGVSFEMIPGKGKMKTAWISNEGKQAGFIVVNDETNDSGTIDIRSFKELLSEYYASRDSKRTYNSGSSIAEFR